MKTVYFLSCETPENGGGVYRYSLSDNGLQKESYYPCDRPMYAVTGENKLFVLLRQPFKDNNNGGCFSIDLELKHATEMRSTNGIVPCHLCAQGSDVYVVNYLSGNLVKIGQQTVTHTGKGINPIRQDMPHTHCAIFSPDMKYVLCCDLGLDMLFCYDRELNLISQAKIQDGYGIRHVVFSQDGKYIYAVSEMIPAIHVFAFDNGRVTFIKKYDIACEKENADGAAIRLSPDGRKLYVSLRVENVIVVYDVQGEDLHLTQKVDCGGDGPRDFNLIDCYLIVANEKSNNVVVFQINDGILEKKQEISLLKPIGVTI